MPKRKRTGPVLCCLAPGHRAAHNLVTVKTLQALDVDNLSPRDALDALYRLKAMLGDGSH